MQRSQQTAQARGRAAVVGCNARLLLQVLQLECHVLVQRRGLGEAAAAEAQPYHRMPLGPIVAVVDVEPCEQRLVALEQLLQRVQKQALAEPPRPRQKVMCAPAEQPLDEGGLVHVVAVLLAQLAERLYPDRQSAPGHRAHLTPSRCSPLPPDRALTRRTTPMAHSHIAAAPDSAAPADRTESDVRAAHRRPPGGTRCARTARGKAHRTLP